MGGGDLGGDLGGGPGGPDGGPGGGDSGEDLGDDTEDKGSDKFADREDDPDFKNGMPTDGSAAASAVFGETAAQPRIIPDKRVSRELPFPRGAAGV